MYVFVHQDELEKSFLEEKLSLLKLLVDVLLSEKCLSAALQRLILTH